MESFLLLLLAQAPVCTFSKCSLSLSLSLCSDKSENGEAYQRKKAVATGLPQGPAALVPPRGNPAQPGSGGWRRIALLILAITIHNIPGEALPPRGPTVGGSKGRSLSAQLPGRKRGADNRDMDPFFEGCRDRTHIFLEFVFNLCYPCGGQPV